MLKKILAVLAMLYAAACFAAVDVNKASAAELDGVKGIGPSTSKRIMDERKKGDFKDWNDFITRVKGVGQGNAAKFSKEGLTVGGAAFSKTAVKAEKKKAKEDKKEAKAAAKDAKPAASAAKAAASGAKPAASAKK
ncbi:helix-hairpin-helix domain-containing protein [Ramlibacter sp.]|uniref:ComEA family DNA-binding protein n=1 Tax=Ramlibacter sp. TaxID=1917967 RepID=UPI0018476A5A|nr:helix-hairpin-helix domain-containing protein [Ramlibacter sp.]MBA2674081.1 helix-hairpin-helix domain-containing protein [Ramlibacter sp.]